LAYVSSGVVGIVFADRALGADRGAALEADPDDEDGGQEADRELDPELAEVPLLAVQDQPRAESGDEDCGGSQSPQLDEPERGRDPASAPGSACRRVCAARMPSTARPPSQSIAVRTCSDIR
jgi:hypothetical protein